MKQFHLTMMCYNCKTKIEDALKKKAYHDFDIDMGTSLLTFESDVNETDVVSVVSKIGYRIIPVEETTFDNTRLTEEDLYGDLFNNKK